MIPMAPPERHVGAPATPFTCADGHETLPATATLVVLFHVPVAVSIHGPTPDAPCPLDGNDVWHE